MDEKPGETSKMVAEDEIKFQPKNKWRFSSLSKGKILLIVISVVALIVILVGIVLIALSSKKKDCKAEGSKQRENIGGHKSSSAFCDYSEEAKRIKLNEVILQTKKSYYDIHPFQLPTDPDATRDEVKKRYTAYNPTPEYIKQVTDTARRLLGKIEQIKVDSDKLKTRERKVLSQLKHYLNTTFGQPFDMNYYTGHWMMGPTIFCHRQHVCQIGKHLNGMLKSLKPESLDDVSLLETKLKTHKEGITRYKENLELGKSYGMVYSQEACVASRDAIKATYLQVTLKKETGILEEDFIKKVLNDDYFSNITAEMKTSWKNDHKGKSVKESLEEYLVEYVGKPMTELFRYLDTDHYRYCVPSNFSSGLGSLPLDHVWVDGKENTSWPTIKMLSSGDVLDGRKAYEMIMPYFTTTNMKPDAVYELGHEQLKILYPQAIEIAKSVTGNQNESEAIKEFRIKLDSPDNYFNKEDFPANESDEQAHKRCRTPEGAEKYCPMRWKAMQSWYEEARMAMSLLFPKLVGMFDFVGDKQSTPNCPIELRPDLNPSSGIQSYGTSDSTCSETAYYNIPFFLARLGPKYSEWTIGAHEARPGHHLQLQGFRENFMDTCGGLIEWLASKAFYTAFVEGWALYAENPLMSDDTDIYNGHPMRKYGMLKAQIWRALRLMVDTGLHYKGMKRDEAIKMFADYAWDDSDFTKKEVTRYQDWPGQATAYMVGRLRIMEARKMAYDTLGKEFNLKDFHYQVLSQGSSPLDFLQEHIQKYVECVQKPDKEGCPDLLNPPKKATHKDEKTKTGIIQFDADTYYA
ncbi:uncharacterized protein [Montipora capricornis]|uniref:uncharacterized protein n=1 Tax=Montipora capricornis TaxID=246305 RepID=UPI0035F19083